MTENSAALFAIASGAVIGLVAIALIKRAARNPLWGLLMGGWLVWGTAAAVWTILWLNEK